MTPSLMHPEQPTQPIPFARDEPHPAYKQTQCDEGGCGEHGYVDYRVLDNDIETYCNQHYDPDQ